MNLWILEDGKISRKKNTHSACCSGSLQSFQQSMSTRQEQKFWHLKTFNTRSAMSIHFCNILFTWTPLKSPRQQPNKNQHIRNAPFFAKRNLRHFGSNQSKNRLHKASHSSMECVVRITARPSMVLEILISSGGMWVVPPISRCFLVWGGRIPELWSQTLVKDPKFDVCRYITNVESKKNEHVSQSQVPKTGGSHPSTVLYLSSSSSIAVVSFSNCKVN